MKHFRGFWLALALGTALLLAPVVVVTRLNAGELAEKPAFPRPGRSFVAEYGGVGAYIAHLLYYWDLAGFGDRIRAADVVMLGSSRMQFGLSADILGAGLSRKTGRPVRVYNAALGCTASLDLATDILRRLGVHDQVIVADGYAMEAYFDPCLYEFFAIADRAQAAFKVATVWTRFDLDWLLDGTLPRIELRDDGVELVRYLNKPATLLDWNNGDVLEQYGPRGAVFPRPVPNNVRRILGDPENVVSWTFEGDHVRPLGHLPELAERGMKPVLTLIPYIANQAHKHGAYGVVEKLVRQGQSGDAPFVAIPAEGLDTFDTLHLTGSSRALASERLIDGLEAAGVLKWLAPDNGPGR